MMLKKFIIAGLSFAMFGASFSAIAQGKEGKTQGQGKAVEVKDVETLNDNLTQYQNQRVTVVGEVEDRIDPRSVMIESGGIIDDEIVVVSKDGKKVDMSQLTDDQKVQVTGTLRTVPVIEIRRETGWDLDPQIVTELETVKAFLVADEVKTL